MRKLFLSSVLVVAAVAIACNPFKKKDDADAASDAAVVAEAEAPPPVVADAAPAAPTITAKNVGDVARFGGETPVTDDDSKLAQLTPVKTGPKSGKVVATLKPGTDVTKFAEYQGCFLVQFPDPADANTTLLGWIEKERFTAVAVRTTTDAGFVSLTDAGGQEKVVKVTCPGGFTAVVLSTTPVCKRKCTKDTDCKAGGCQTVNSQAGGVTRACSGE